MAASPSPGPTRVATVRRHRKPRRHRTTPTATPPRRRGHQSVRRTGPAWSPEQRRQVVFNGPRRPVVYLTFDDGMGPIREIGKILASLQVRATFCVNGWVVREDPTVAAYLTRLGHVLCNHTWSHAAVTALSDAAVTYELMATEEWISSNGGGTTRPFFRPPYGAYDQRTVELIASLGYRTIRWSLDPADWQCNTTPQGLADRVVSQVRPGDIVLLHTHGCVTPAALPLMVKGLREQGYRLRALDSLP